MTHFEKCLFGELERDDDDDEISNEQSTHQGFQTLKGLSATKWSARAKTTSELGTSKFLFLFKMNMRTDDNFTVKFGINSI
jgi:hypothetical protein